MKYLRRLYYKLFPTYARLEIKLFTYPEADRLIRDNHGKSESKQWVIAKEEDYNQTSPMNPMVFLERKVRITE